MVERVGKSRSKGPASAVPVEPDVEGEGDDPGAASRTRAPARRPRSGGSAIRIADHLKRLDEIEDMLVAGVPVRRVTRLVAEKYGMSRRNARRYIRAVSDRWREESAASREDKRAEMEARLVNLLRLAIDKKMAFLQDGEVVEYSSPDIRGASSALELLCRLHGLLEQDGAPVVNLKDVVIVQQKLQQVYGLAGDVAEGVRVIDAGEDDDGSC